MPVPINVKSPNNISKWQMGFNSAFKGLTSALDHGGWSTPLSSRFTLGKDPMPIVHGIRGWVGRRVVLDGAENLAPLEFEL
jgi:hypothetical protein